MSSEPGLQEAKSQRARDAICQATIESLYQVGYSETSLNRVAQAAGFSKGALQHHFPSKEDLIAATLERLLSRTEQPSKVLPKSLEEALLGNWTRFINTPGYRALMEILNTARTDQALQRRIGAQLTAWGDRLDRQSTKRFESVSGSEEELVMLMNMTRSFMRGLLIQEQYGVSKEKELEYVKKWIELIAPLMKLRSQD